MRVHRDLRNQEVAISLHLRLVAVLLVVGGIASLSACVQETPIVSEHSNKTTNMTLDEQREWVEAQLDAGVAATGITEGWYWHPESKIPWLENAEAREQIKSSWLPRDCSLGGRLVQSVNIKREQGGVENPAEVGASVRAFWESQGWTVTDLWPDAPAEKPHFIIEGEDGATISFQATLDGASLSVESACSVNNTVTNWDYYSELAAEQEASLMTKEEVGAELDLEVARVADALGITDPLPAVVSSRSCETIEELPGVFYFTEHEAERPPAPAQGVYDRVSEVLDRDGHRSWITDVDDGGPGRILQMESHLGHAQTVADVSVTVLENDLRTRVYVASQCLLVP